MLRLTVEAQERLALLWKTEDVNFVEREDEDPGDEFNSPACVNQFFMADWTGSVLGFKGHPCFCE